MTSGYSYDDKQVRHFKPDNVIRMDNEDGTYDWWVVVSSTENDDNDFDVHVRQFIKKPFINDVDARELIFTVSGRMNFLARRVQK